ncbi:MAG: ATP-binding cassette domain-containing protein [Cypionkella sp.]
MINPANNPAPLLTVEGLKVHFNAKRAPIRAVDGVSFSLERGETLGIVGESGSGKTTTGMAIINLVEATSGQVRFDGVDLTKLPLTAKARAVGIAAANSDRVSRPVLVVERPQDIAADAG